MMQTKMIPNKNPCNNFEDIRFLLFIREVLHYGYFPQRLDQERGRLIVCGFHKTITRPSMDSQFARSKYDMYIYIYIK